MFVVTDQSLTLPLAAALTPGAHKLLTLARLEPTATQKHLMELSGYSERSVRNFTTELEGAGLVRRLHTGQSKPQVEADKPSFQACKEPTSPAFRLLVEQGVTDHAAHVLAQQHDETLVRAAVAYVTARSAHNAPAYLIWCLEHADAWYSSATVPNPSPAPIVEAAIASREELVASIVEVPSVLVPAEQDQEVVLLAYAVEAATGTDIRLDEEVRSVVHKLHHAGYHAEDVASFVDRVWPKEWQGRKGERPTCDILLKKIAIVRHERTAFGESLSERVRTMREYTPLSGTVESLGELWTQVRRQADANEQDAGYCQKCERSYAMCLCDENARPLDYAGEDARMWYAMKGQFEVQLNHATFNTWVAPVRLIGYERLPEHDRFIAEVPNSYAKDWIEKHLLASMLQTLGRLQQRVVHITLKAED